MLVTANGQLPFGNPYLGLQYNPYTSPLFGYGLGPQYNTLYGALASNYLYGSMAPYLGYPGTYGVYGMGSNGLYDIEHGFEWDVRRNSNGIRRTRQS